MAKIVKIAKSLNFFSVSALLGVKHISNSPKNIDSNIDIKYLPVKLLILACMY